MSEPLLAMNFLPLDVARPGGSTDFEQRYGENWLSCSGTPVSIGDSLEVISPHPHFTGDGIQYLINQDPGAYWDGNSIQGSAFLVSPRLITIAVIDPDGYAQQVRPGANVRATVVNFVGLFLEPTFAADLQGVIVPTSGTFDSGAPSVTEQAAFLRTLALVR